MRLFGALSPTLFPHTPRPVRFISNLIHIDRAGSTARRPVTALVAALILLTTHVSPVTAQSERGYEIPPSVPQTVQRGPDAPAGASLPPWAEPQRPSPSPSSPGDDPGLGSPVTANGLGPPDNPNRVPLGGMEWLHCFEVGWMGVRRARSSSEALWECVAQDRERCGPPISHQNQFGF